MKVVRKYSQFFLKLLLPALFLTGCVASFGGGAFNEQSTMLESIHEPRTISNTEHTHKRGGGADTLGKFAFNSSTLESYLKKIAKRLEKGWPYQVPPYDIKVIYGDHINAHATAQSTIFYPSGWFHGAESEDEIAAVLAHEMAHILLAHPMDKLKQDGASDMVNTIQKSVLLGVYLKNVRLDKSSDTMQLAYGGNAKDKRELALVSWAGERLYKAKVDLLDPAFTRCQEEEADFLAIDLLMKANYTPIPFRDDVMDRLQSSDEKKKERLALAEKEWESRQEMVNASIKEAVVGGDIESAATLSFFSAYNHSSRFFSGLYNSGRATHFDPKTRSKNIKKYLKAHYPSRKDYPKKSRKKLKRVLRRVAFETTQENHITSDIAAEKLAEGQVREASRLGLKPLRSSAKKSPYPWYVLGGVRYSQGKMKDARVNFSRAVALNGPPESYTKLAQVYLDKKQYKSAKNALDKGVRRFAGDKGPFFLQYALFAKAQGKKDVFQQILDECKVYPDKVIVAQCQGLEEVDSEYNEVHADFLSDLSKQTKTLQKKIVPESSKDGSWLDFFDKPIFK